MTEKTEKKQVAEKNDSGKNERSKEQVKRARGD